jgi:hypothetical protein
LKKLKNQQATMINDSDPIDPAGHAMSM